MDWSGLPKSLGDMGVSSSGLPSGRDSRNDGSCWLSGGRLLAATTHPVAPGVLCAMEEQNQISDDPASHDVARHQWLFSVDLEDLRSQFDGGMNGVIIPLWPLDCQRLVEA